jgi:hypothetical protein
VVLAGASCGSKASASAANGEDAIIYLNLATGIGPGTYTYSPDGGVFQAAYAFISDFYGGVAVEPGSGSLTITSVDPLQGIAGSYSLDFGGSGVSGGSNGNFGSLGELIEVGAFTAPPCDLCGLGTSAVADAGALGAPVLTACADLYMAAYTLGGGPTLPPEEQARQLARFQELCMARLALPSVELSAGRLETCAASLDAGSVAGCEFTGSLPPGGECIDGAQCSSGACSSGMGVTFTPEGPIGEATCGSCYSGQGSSNYWPPPRPTATDGGECQQDEDCERGLGCVPSGAWTSPTACSSPRICQPIGWVGSGAPCSLTTRCLVGYCNYPDFGLVCETDSDGGLVWGQCPVIIPDGDPCMIDPANTQNCDAFAECFEGACLLAVPPACQ